MSARKTLRLCNSLEFAGKMVAVGGRDERSRASELRLHLEISAASVANFVEELVECLKSKRTRTYLLLLLTTRGRRGAEGCHTSENMFRQTSPANRIFRPSRESALRMACGESTPAYLVKYRTSILYSQRRRRHGRRVRWAGQSTIVNWIMTTDQIRIVPRGSHETN